MTRILLRAGALSCALALGACNTTSLNSATQAAVQAIVANPANATAAQIIAALRTTEPSVAAKVEAAASQASAYVTAACGIVPLASSLAAIAAAAYGASGAVLPATQIAGAFCAPFTTPATPSARVAVARRVGVAGSFVSREVNIAGIRVRAEGTLVDPALAR